MLSVGQTFARYVIEASIGQGGMGEVYRAHDENLRRKVALKVLHPDLAVPDAAARMVREAREVELDKLKELISAILSFNLRPA